ncbi:MAG: hypothetical protein KGP14_01830 [Betaproteobacteria bacterium]|nr:hypothetical protein [Betaproteobacteria bacterium]
MPTSTSAAPRQLSDGNSQGTQLGGVNNSVGTPDKVAFFGQTPTTQPTAATNVHTVAAGSTTAVFINTTFDGSIGTTAYTLGDVVAALKTLGLIKS